MLIVYRWLRYLSHMVCFCAVLGSLLPAQAQFIPDKGVTVQHLKAPKEGRGFDRCYWLNDHELVYIQRTTGTAEQYCKLDVTTRKEQALVGFTKIVRDTIEANRSLPPIFPSPDRKYLTWVGTNDRSEYTLVVATREGTIIIRKPSKPSIHYPSWSADSQWCFGFLEVQAPDDEKRDVFNALMAVSMKAPHVVKNYPISLKSEWATNALSGSRGYNLSSSGSPPLQLPDFHFGSENNILLVSELPGIMRGEVQFDEYTLTDTVMPVSTRTLHLPAFGDVEYAVFSPQGDSIVWKFHQANDEFWISDKDGGHMKRLGKFPPEHQHTPRFVATNPDDIKWLPSGKGISFLEEGGLCVISLEAYKVSK